MSSYDSSNKKPKFNSSSSSTNNRNASSSKPYDRKPNPNGGPSGSSFARPIIPPSPFAFESNATTLQGKKFISLSSSDDRRSNTPGSASASSGRFKPGVKQESGDGAAGRKIQTNLGEEMELFQKGIKDESGRVNEFKSADDECPVCKTHRVSKPSLRLLISPCYHKVCDSCVDKLFSLSSQACPNPTCTRILRKTQFHHQTFEDLVVEQEVSVRRRMGSIFNKTREDFDSDRSYNDYLEQVEDWTYNILNNVDRAETEYKIQEWQQANASDIATNAIRQAHDSELEREQEAEEQAEKTRRAQMALQEDVETERLIEKYKREQLEDVQRGGDGSEAKKKLQALRDGMGEIKDVMSAKEDRIAAGRVTRKIASMAKKHAPTSPRYAGPYIPLPWVHPESVIQVEFGGNDWVTELVGEGKPRLEDREGMMISLKMHGDSGRVQAGGYKLQDVWKRDLAAVQDSLLVGL